MGETLENCVTRFWDEGRPTEYLKEGKICRGKVQTLECTKTIFALSQSAVYVGGHWHFFVDYVDTRWFIT